MVTIAFGNGRFGVDSFFFTGHRQFVAVFNFSVRNKKESLCFPLNKNRTQENYCTNRHLTASASVYMAPDTIPLPPYSALQMALLTLTMKIRTIIPFNEGLEPMTTTTVITKWKYQDDLAELVIHNNRAKVDGDFFSTALSSWNRESNWCQPVGYTSLRNLPIMTPSWLSLCRHSFEPI